MGKFYLGYVVGTIGTLAALYLTFFHAMSGRCVENPKFGILCTFLY